MLQVLLWVTNFAMHDGHSIQWFHMLRLAQYHVTIANKIVYVTITT